MDPAPVQREIESIDHEAPFEESCGKQFRS